MFRNVSSLLRDYTMTLDHILDEAELLPEDELIMFNEIFTNRVLDVKIKELIETVEKSRMEYTNGMTIEASAGDIMKEITA